MQIATYLAQYTGLTVDQLFNGPNGPLVDPHVNVDGSWFFPIWNVAGKKPPTSDQIITALAAPEPSGILPSQHDFLGFLALFTAAEQTAIVSSSNAQVKLFCLMAAGANFIDLSDPRVSAAVNQLESLTLIGKGRAAQVLAAHPAPIA